MRKYVQTMNGPLFVAGKSKKCGNLECAHSGMHYYANGGLRLSLPYSTYGLDVLALIGWQHEHKQFVEIQHQFSNSCYGKTPGCSRDFVIAQDALRSKMHCPGRSALSWMTVQGTGYAIWKSRLQSGSC